jgi:hypothetical protein
VKYGAIGVRTWDGKDSMRGLVRAVAAFGVVPPGRLLDIRIPQIGFVDFVKAGHSTQQCNDPDAVVPVNEGQSVTPDQIRAIFGQPEPHFSTARPLTFVACVGTAAGEALNWRNIEISVLYD